MIPEYCKECKKKVSFHTKFCPKCGVPAPTTIFSRKNPKCIIEDCYEYAETSGKKFQGQCAKHYAGYIDKSALIVSIVIFVVIILISVS
jgi:predicted amidophosphoribosyltransferase